MLVVTCIVASMQFLLSLHLQKLFLIAKKKKLTNKQFMEFYNIVCIDRYREVLLRRSFVRAKKIIVTVKDSLTQALTSENYDIFVQLVCSYNISFYRWIQEVRLFTLCKYYDPSKQCV